MSELPNQRALVLARLLKGKVDRVEAMLLLGLSARSIRRLTARLVAAGPDALVHGNSGRRPAHARDPQVAARVVAFAPDGYAGLNDTHFCELLAERKGIVLSGRTVQRPRSSGLRPRRRLRRAHRRDRTDERRAGPPDDDDEGDEERASSAPT